MHLYNNCTGSIYNVLNMLVPRTSTPNRSVPTTASSPRSFYQVTWGEWAGEAATSAGFAPRIQVKSRPRTGVNHLPKTRMIWLSWHASNPRRQKDTCKIFCPAGFQGLPSHLFPFHSSLICAAHFCKFPKHPSNQAAMRMTPKPSTFETGRNGMTQASAMASKTKAKSKTSMMHRSQWCFTDTQGGEPREVIPLKLNLLASACSFVSCSWRNPIRWLDAGRFAFFVLCAKEHCKRWWSKPNASCFWNTGKNSNKLTMSHFLLVSLISCLNTWSEPYNEGVHCRHHGCKFQARLVSQTKSKETTPKGIHSDRLQGLHL